MAAALAAAGLDLPADRIVGEQGATLSGGEVRRLALARLLAGDPGTPQTAQVFVLDEPTEHLDAETAETLMEDLWRVCGDSPVIVVTHDPEVVAQCSRVVQMAPSRAGSTARR